MRRYMLGDARLAPRRSAWEFRMPPSFVARAFALVVAAAAVAFSGVAACAAPQLQIAANVGTFTLGNGLEVVVIPDHRTPTVTHMVWYRVGAADDPPGTSGIAHFLEHLMFMGTAAHPAGEFAAKVAEIGGEENAFTTEDYTVFHESVAKEHLGLMMEYEADRMANLMLTEDAVLPERKVILEERRMRIDNDPGSRLAEAVGAALYQNSHYGIPTIGWAEEMAKLDRSDAIAFYDRYYTPNNAILIIAGDVTEAEVRTLAEATYGKLARRAEPLPRARAVEPAPIASRSVTLADARVTEPTVQRSYLVPSYSTAAPGEAEAIDVLSEVLGDGATSRLYKRLVLGKAVATSAGAGYSGTAIGDTSFGVFALPRGDVTPAALAGEIDGVIAELIDKGISDDELARAKRRMLASAIYAQDSQATLARVFGEAIATGRSVADAQNWPNAIQAVTADQVVAAARKYLDIRRSATGYLIGAPPETRS
jgi:zinc protease